MINQSKKILIVNDFNQNSVYLQTISKEFQKHNYIVEFLTFSEPGSLSEYLKRDNIVIHHFVSKKKSKYSKYIESYKYLKNLHSKEKYTHIFSHLAFPNLICAIGSRFFKNVKIVICRHHTDMFYQENIRKGIMLDRITQKIAKNISVVSQNAHDLLMEREHVPSKKVYLLPYLYDFSMYETSMINSKKESKFINFVFVSRIVELKRIQFILPIVKQLKDEGERVEIQIIGDGPYLDELIKKANDLNISDQIIFHGFQTNPLTIMGQSDALILLSASESSNQVVKEAGLLSIPVIACKDVGDFNTYLSSENAYLLELNFSLDELLKIIKQIIAEPESRILKGKKLNQSVFSNFSITNEKFNVYLECFK